MGNDRYVSFQAIVKDHHDGDIHSKIVDRRGSKMMALPTLSELAAFMDPHERYPMALLVPGAPAGCLTPPP
jgi:hypothetical protein